MDEDKKYVVLEDTVRQSYVSVVWSHKIQEKQADLYARQFGHMETAKIIAASLTSAGIISTIFVDELVLKIISAILSFVTVFVSSFFKSFNLQNMVAQHKAAANNLLRIRDELLLLLLAIKTRDKHATELSDAYSEIIVRLHGIYADAPSTTNKAVSLASKALKVSGDNTFSDSEINGFLPEHLRREE